MLTAQRQFVLDPQEFRLLDGLRLSPRKSFSGRVRGERLTRRKGISIEFADYRDYTDGDDLRHLDWNVLARLETPVIKTYQDEEDLAVYIAVDCSASMDFGQPTKMEAAKRMAAALGYLALTGLDAAMPRALGIKQPPLPSLRGRANYPRLANWINGLRAEGQRGLSNALREFAGASERAGIVMLLTDGLDQDLRQTIRILAGRGHEVDLVQILSPEELDPDLEGDLRLLDAESGAPVEITANSLALKGYKENLDKHCSGLEAECLRVGGRYVRITPDEALEVIIGQKLKRGGWVTS